MESFQQECNGCGRTFAHTNAFSNHQRTCKKSKARLSSALASARENWARLKRARISSPEPNADLLPHAYQWSPSTGSLHDTPLPSTSHPNATSSARDPSLSDSPSPPTAATTLLGATVIEVNEVTLTTSSYQIILMRTSILG